MRRTFFAALGSWKEIWRVRGARSTFAMNRVAFFMLLGSMITTPAAAQNVPNTPPNAQYQNCSALMQLNLENVPGGPALITSARLVDVPVSGLEQWPITTSGYGKMGVPITTNVGQYCDVTGYVSPQSKFRPPDLAAILRARRENRMSQERGCGIGQWGAKLTARCHSYSFQFFLPM